MATNLLSNPGFETAGGGGADVFANWTEGGAGVTDETTIVRTGSNAAKLSTVLSTSSGQVFQTVTTVAGQNYRVTFWTRGDGTNGGIWGLRDSINATWYVENQETGVTGVTWTKVTYEFTANSTGTQLYLRSPGYTALTVTGSAYFDDCEIRTYALAYVKPILDACITIFKASLNTKLDDISSDYKTVETDSYSNYFELLPERTPWVSVFPFGDSSINSDFETGDSFEATWQISTVVDLVADDAEQLQEYLDAYITAIIRSLTSGSTGNIWTINQTVDLLRLVRVGYTSLDSTPAGTIAGAAYAIWEGVGTYNPTTE